MSRVSPGSFGALISSFVHRGSIGARGTAVLCAAFAVALPQAQAQESPFIPDGFGTAAPPPTAPSAVDRYEFRGVMVIGDETFITLVDTSTSKTITSALGETIGGVRVISFEASDNSVQIEVNGQTKRAKLPEPKIVAMAAPPPPPMAPQNGPLAQSPPQGQPPAVAGAPISDEEARMRMQRVAEEIRRRREMRRQMLENQQQPQRPQ